MKRCLMVTGGPLDLDFAAGFLKDRQYDLIIAVDAGFTSCLKLGIRPDLLVGDFDTFGREEILKYRSDAGFAFDIHEPEKDETDTELAVRDALKAGCSEADLLGATGGRIDHELSNLYLLAQAKRQGLSVTVYDRNNRISVLDAGAGKKREFWKETSYGTYISFLPLTETVKGITLTGFKYPLTGKDISMRKNPGLCVSNEICGERAVITFEDGILLCVESGD